MSLRDLALTLSQKRTDSQLFNWIMAVSAAAGGPGPGGSFVQAETVYVDKNGDDTAGDGSFNNPFLTVQVAIDATAGTAAVPYVVQVAPGVYADPFELRPFVWLRGMGEATVLNPDANIISADFAGAVDADIGIADCTIAGVLVADLNARAATGLVRIFLSRVAADDAWTFTGNTVTQRVFLDSINHPLATGPNPLTISDMGFATLNSVSWDGNSNLVLNGTDAYPSVVHMVGCGKFVDLVQTWTGADPDVPLELTVDNHPFRDLITLVGDGAVIMGRGLTKVYELTASTVFRFFNAAGADEIGIQNGTNFIYCNPAGDMLLTLGSPNQENTRCVIKNITPFYITLAYQPATLSAPSYIGPFGSIETSFNAGNGDWSTEEVVQSGTTTLVNGVSPLITADISANSIVVATLRTFTGGPIGVITAKIADYVNGARGTTGGFVLTSVLQTTGATVATDQSVYNWFVFPGKNSA